MSLVAFALAASSGCFRYRTHVPGVIDMRTDARDVPPARARLKNLRENEVLLLVGGRGVISQGQRLIVEDRHFWVAGLIPLFNTDANDELAVLVDATGAVRDLQIGEGQSFIDVLAALVLPQFLPLVGYVLPSYTFHAHGTPIRLEKSTPLSVETAHGRDTPVVEDPPRDATVPSTLTPPVVENAPPLAPPAREEPPAEAVSNTPPGSLDAPFDPSDEEGEK